MKTISRALALMLSLGVSQPVSAYNAECNPTVLKEANEHHASLSLCSALEPKHFETCVGTLFMVGGATFLAGMFATGEGSSQVRNTAAQANMSRLRLQFSPELKKIVEQIKTETPGVRQTRALLAEFKKHPRVYSNQVTNISTALRLKTLGRYLKVAGAFAMVMAYVEATMFTPPEDCKVLNLTGIQPEDRKWVDFGMNCTRHIDTEFFTQSLEDQVTITQRSPDLCKALLRYDKDLQKFIVKTARASAPAAADANAPSPTPASAN